MVSSSRMILPMQPRVEWDFTSLETYLFSLWLHVEHIGMESNQIGGIIENGSDVLYSYSFTIGVLYQFICWFILFRVFHYSSTNIVLW